MGLCRHVVSMFGLGLEKLHDNSGTQSIHSYTRKEVKKIHYTDQMGDKS